MKSRKLIKHKIWVSWLVERFRQPSLGCVTHLSHPNIPVLQAHLGYWDVDSPH